MTLHRWLLLGLMLGWLLSACAATQTTTPAPTRTPRPIVSLVPTITPNPPLAPDPFCAADFVVPDGQGGLMCQRTGLPYKFIGVNTRELAYLADQNPKLDRTEVYRVDLTGANPGILQTQLETASRMGAKVVRLFAPRFYDANSAIHTLDDILAANDKVLAIARLLEAHQRIEALKFIIVFTDFYAAPPSFSVYNLHCPGYSANDFSDPFCTLMPGEPPHLKPDWFTRDYARGYAQPTFGEGSYRQYVETLIRHYTVPISVTLATASIQIVPQQILAWELGNELKVDDPQQAVSIMQGFVRDVACFIHQVDRHPRLVAPGFVSTFHATNGQGHDPAALYDLRCADGRAVFDLGTVHVYNNQWWLPRGVIVPHNERNFGDRLDQYVDYRWFQAHPLPYIVEELGFTGGNRTQAGDRCMDSSFTNDNAVWSGSAARGDGSGADVALPATGQTRGPAVAAALDRFFALNASGVLPWAFQAGSVDLGAHDACRGLDPIYHTDWADLFEAYCEQARRLDQRTLACQS
ncbi:MAG: hypothetical protein HY870_17250 [Chloroflexi bacterium]|nr:hypothetical protein [Chloroflexota bacterium]